MMKRPMLILVAALGIVIGAIGEHLLPASIDEEGFWRDPSLLELFIPPVEGAYRASIIKTIQTGSVTINTGATTGTATLTTSVTSTSTVIVPGGTVTANSAGNGNWGDGTFDLTNPTTVTLTCPDAGVSPSCAGAFTAVEFYPNTLTGQAVQRGTITLGAAQTSNTATIGSVGSKAALYPCGFRVGNVRSAYTQTRQVLTNATTVTATRQDQDGASTGTACYQVADFK